MKSAITFYGGVGTVTGANFLLDTGTKKIVIDCGILQQEHACSQENFADFAPDVLSADALIVTHAHADHIGRIPKLVHDGFNGTIYSTAATRDLASLMFDDALRVMQEHELKHHCGVLYAKEDIEKALSLWEVKGYHEAFDLGDVRIEFGDSGHILGAVWARISRGNRSVVFTGDLGNSPEPLLRDMEMPAGTNYIVMESVYGDRVHEDRKGRKEMLRQTIEETRQSGGTLLIPSFSIERTQVLLYELNDMIESNEMAPIPMFLDSPLAIRITDVFRRYKELFNDTARSHFERQDDPFAFPGFKVTLNTEESSRIRRESDPKVIIAGAGMSEGGRIRSHEKEYLPRKDCSILFVGYQTPGSLGRRILDGEKKVQIDGEYVRVRARVGALTGYSGHADRDQLLNYVEGAGESLEKVFVTMGEPRSSLFFAQRVKDFLGVESLVPERDQRVEIEL